MMAAALTVTAEHLGTDAIARTLAERHAAYAHAPAGSAGERRAALAWTLGDERYATPIADVAEVAPLPRVTQVPGAPAVLVGVVGWRGALLNLFDVAALLGAPLPTGSEQQMLVLRHDAPRIALRVSSLVGIVHVPPADGADRLSTLVEADDGTNLAAIDTHRLIERLLAPNSSVEG